MTLDTYKKECVAVLEAFPKNAGSLEYFFQELALAKLWNLADEADERKECLNYWLSLPVSDELRQDVLRKIEAAGGNR